MNSSKDTTIMPTPQREVTLGVPGSRHLRRWLIAVGILVLVFAWPLWQLAMLSFRSELHSHVVLIPFVSGYLVWLNRSGIVVPAKLSPRAAVAPGVLGLALALIYACMLAGIIPVAVSDSLAVATAAFLLLFVSLCGFFFGSAQLRRFAFPLGFLIFAIPMPVVLVHGIETFLQHGSAAAAHVMFSTAGTPFYRQDLVFQLPGISLQVAPECSGIRSTLALFITSVVAGYLFLKSPWRRFALAVAVVPLALLRNGFRVFTLGELCVHVSPDMIDSYIHHHGGPIFFALSLIPFAAILAVLMKTERPRTSGVLAEAAA